MPYATAKKYPYGFPIHFLTDFKDNPYVAITFFCSLKIMTFTVFHCSPVWSFNEEQLKVLPDNVTIVKICWIVFSLEYNCKHKVLFHLQ